MLRNEHALAVCREGCIYPDRLFPGRDASYASHGEEMLRIYRSGAGMTRGALHRSVKRILAGERNCEDRRIRAFCKLLDDAAEFDTDREGRAAQLRLHLFFGEARSKDRVARALDRPWHEISAALYGDLRANHRLRSFPGYPDGGSLLSRYNVAQVQACLYRAESLVIHASEGFKTILRHAKLARLLHAIQRLGPSRYRIELSGPAAVLGRTRRYGVHMARFLPALLSCRGWTLAATVQAYRSSRARLLLSDRDGLRSHLPPPEAFDSALEQAFARAFGREREGWRLFREAEILHQGQKTFVPDFVFRHRSGCQVLFEIAGFWTEEYLARKKETLKRFRSPWILLALPERSAGRGMGIADRVILYKTDPDPETVCKALEAIRKEGLRCDLFTRGW